MTGVKRRKQQSTRVYKEIEQSALLAASLDLLKEMLYKVARPLARKQKATRNRN